MLRRSFGSTGRDVPVIGQGTWKVQDPERARLALGLGLDLGLRHIDTAELYRGAEELLAPVIAGRREEVFLVSKVLPSNASYDGVLAACERSLEKLGTDHLDSYLLHWPSDRHPLEDTMAAMGELVDRGLVRHVGVSNFDVGELKDAQQALDRPIACDQVLFHLGDRGAEHDLLPHCEREGIAVVGYSPFGSGRFPPRGRKERQVLERVAARHDATIHQVALRFLAGRGENLFLIPKAETPRHVKRNAAAMDLELTREDEAAIDAAFPVGPRRPLGFL